MDNETLLRTMADRYRKKESIEDQLNKLNYDIEKDTKELDYRIKHKLIK
jgi:hypothetical protein